MQFASAMTDWRRAVNQNQADGLVRTNDELLRQFVEYTPAAVAMLDRDMRYLITSRRFITDYGLPEDPVGRSHYDVFPELSRRVKEIHLRCLAGAVESCEEDPFPRQDGSLDWVRWEMRPWYETDGEIGGVILFSEVISQRKKSEEALRQSESRYRTLLESLPQRIFFKDTGSVYISANQSYARDLGIPAEALPGKTDYDLYPRELAEKYRADDRRILETAETEEMEERYVRAGEMTWVHTVKTPVRDSEGNITGVLGIFWDITGRKRAEAEHEALTRHKQLALDAAHMGWFHLDPVSNLAEYDKTYCEFFGLEEGASAIAASSDAVHPDDRARVWDAISAALDPQAQGPYHATFRVLRSDGTTRWGEANGVVTFEGEGAERHAVSFDGTVQDITQRILAEEERERLQLELAQAQRLESVGRLAGGVAHDFNNMLGVILGHTELALAQLNPEEDLFRQLSEVRKAAEHSSDIIRQLLGFARRQTAAPRVLDLNDAVGHVLAMMRALIGENVDLLWLPGQSLWPVRMDPAQLDQILANLCANARDAIADVGRVTVEAKNITLDDTYCHAHAGFVPGDYVFLSVSDDGHGMDEATLNRIFEPFFSTKALGRGTGLGLATVYGIVKQNGGLVNVYSELDRGTSFHIYLPRHVGEASHRPAAAGAPQLAGGTETILLAEDEPAVARVTTEMLRRLGYKVLVGLSPREALREAETHAGKIDLLITDVVMPEMNGRDLATTVLSLRPGLRYMFTSGYAAEVIGSTGVLDPEVHFLQKPFSTEALAAMVRQVLDEELEVS